MSGDSGRELERILSAVAPETTLTSGRNVTVTLDPGAGPAARKVIVPAAALIV